MRNRLGLGLGLAPLCWTWTVGLGLGLEDRGLGLGLGFAGLVTSLQNSVIRFFPVITLSLSGWIVSEQRTTLATGATLCLLNSTTKNLLLKSLTPTVSRHAILLLTLCSAQVIIVLHRIMWSWYYNRRFWPPEIRGTDCRGPQNTTTTSFGEDSAKTRPSSRCWAVASEEKQVAQLSQRDRARFVPLNISLSHSRSLEVSRNDTLQ